VTIPNSARQNPMVKSTQWMHERDGMKKSDAYETLLLDENGAILEGTSSNFYAILEDTLHTAGDGVLGGIARSIIYDIAPAILPLNKMPIHITDLPRLQEAFITSSSRGIIPVVKIDDTVIGDGVVGETTQRLREAYLAWVDGHLEEL
ncbi:MAG TPA: aminotransferase class IV, partial [Aggregatilineales bacterium]|nr:aminotransferase class IV [Aggregatilineales bacterium]